MNDGSIVFAEFFISGFRKADGARFDFPSSVALIRVLDGRISHYQDYPNSSGIRKAAGWNKLTVFTDI